MALNDLVPYRPMRAAEFGAGAAAPAAVIDLRDFLSLIRRRRTWVLWPAAACTAAALIFVAVAPVRYKATAQLLLDPQGLRVLQNDLTPRTDQGEAQLADAESQLQVISSGEVLTAVVERERLQDDPEFGAAPPGLLGSLLSLFTDAPTEQDRVLKAVRTLRYWVATSRPDKTFVIDVSVWSKDRNKAARIANDIASTYLEQQLAARSDAAKRTNAALVARFAELRERVSQSAHRVEDYKAQHQIVGAGGELVNEQQLSELNKQFVLAQTATADQRSRYEDILRLQRDRSDPDAIAEVVQSPTITALVSRYADAKRALADQAALGPLHPKYQAAAEQVKQMRGLIDDEVARIGKVALSDYNRARANEEALQQKLQALKAEVTSTNESLVRLRELEREAESDRAVYDAMLSRAKEVGEQEGVDDNNSRVITRAVPPLDKSGPPRLLIIAGALGCGLLAGFGLALASEQLAQDGTAEHESGTELGMRVLARMPDCSKMPTPVFAPKSAHAAAIRQLLDALDLDSRGGEASLVLFDSPNDADLRSTVALNFAIGAGERGRRVLLVEGDDRPGGAGPARETHGVQNEGAGGRSNPIRRTPWHGVKVMQLRGDAAEGRPSADEAYDALLVSAHDFDLVLLDGSQALPGQTSRDALFVDAVVLVIRKNLARAAKFGKALQAAGSAPENVTGAVLVG